jgi:hypothetical protein
VCAQFFHAHLSSPLAPLFFQGFLMRKVLSSTVLGTVLGLALLTTGCKKENKDAAAGSAAAAVAAAGEAAGSAAAAAGSAAVAAGSAAVAAGEAAGSAAVAAGEAAGAAAAAPGARPASVTDADVAMAEKMVSLMEKLSSGVTDAGADCAKAAASIKSVGGEISAVMDEGKKMEERLKGDDAAKKWFEGTYAPKVMGPMTKMMGSPCANDKGVQEAMSSLKM